MNRGLESESAKGDGARRWIRGHIHVAGEGGKGSKGEEPVPILLLHGFTGSADSWGADLIPALARHRRVLAVDLPGHGVGAEVPDPARCSVEAVVAGLCDLLNEQGISRADWVGYSMGGRIALAAAVLRPDRVRRLVLESASPGIEGDADRERRRREDDDLARAIEDRGIEWFVDYWMGLPLFETQEVLPIQVLQEARAQRRRGRAEAYAAALRGMGAGVQPSWWAALEGVEAPTLLLTGESDEKYESIAVTMAALLPDSEHYSFAGVGHNLHIEAPDRWLEAVDEFLAR